MILDKRDMVIINKGLRLISVLSLNFGIFEWPAIISHNNQNFRFVTQRPISSANAGTYGGKAEYELVGDK